MTLPRSDSQFNHDDLTQEFSSGSPKQDSTTNQLDAQDDSDSSPSRKRYLPWTATDSSDADTSDTENAQDTLTLTKKLKNMKAKIRQLSYDTIRMLLLTINKKERFGSVVFK